MLFAKLSKDFNDCIASQVENPNKPKKISCEEQEKKVFLKVEKTERALVLVIDDNFSGTCGRRRINCQGFKSPKKCDILIHFSSNDGKLKNIIFVELKGVRIGDAVKQLKASIKYFEKKYDKKGFGYKIGAVIIHGGGAPRKVKDPKLKRLVDLYPLFTSTTQGTGVYP